MMMPMQNNRYLETSIQTASPAQLLLMLYDGAIRFCKAGIEALHQKRYSDANINLMKVQNIVKEFMVTLDQKAPIAQTLMPLYEYFNHQLIEANVSKNPVPAEEVLGYLIELRETWYQASKQVTTQQSLNVKHG